MGTAPGRAASTGTASLGAASLGAASLGAAAFAAVDLGASGGRVMVGQVRAGHHGAGQLDLHEAHRFPNTPVRVLGTLHWDILRLYRGMLDGLGAAARSFSLASVGIDSWGVDYGLLDADGALLGNPVHYRDTRTDGVVDEVLAKVPAADLYGVTGIQQMSINTIYQLAAAARTPQLAAARTLLLIPDLLAYWLTGEIGAEVTNASTTQLYDTRARDWAWDLIGRAGLPAGLFPALREPGSVIGTLRPELAAEPGLGGLAGSGPAGPGPAGPGSYRRVGRLPVIAVGSHDTASAVVAVPAQGRDFAYISCGTWSLVGMELDQAVLTEASRTANFTNETGVDGTIRYLRNVMGLWLLQESVRAWAGAGRPADLATLLEQAARVPALQVVVDPDDPAFLPPGDMPARIAEAARRTGQNPPADPPAVVRCILDSLALAYRACLRDVQELSGRAVDTVHVVGGGVRNPLLLQLTADACGLPVVAGPAEAAALGNILVQARALGAAPGDLDGMRALLRATQPLRRFEPSGGAAAAWDAAATRIGL
ncbi:MAG TPA: rhamnulokinase family protein [Streptosporangiaceae bacterium]|nr:rhamnulokinase family protein [Streptosporangiaceae bacterium]